MNPLHLMWTIPAGVVGIRILCAIGRLPWWFAPSPILTHRIAATVLAARRAGLEPGDALVAMTWQANMPWCWRLARAGRSMSGGSTICLADALAAERLLPRDVAAIGRVAYSLGPVAEERWLADLAADGGEPRMAPLIGYALATAAIVAAIVSFIAVFILPKWEAIMRDLSVPVDQSMQLSESGLVGLGIAVLLGILFVAAWAWWWWRWRTVRHAVVGGLLAAATAAGAAEAEIAAALAPRLPSAGARRVEAAGAAGDWPGLCAAVGWRVKNHEDLNRALAAFERRRAWMATMVAACARIMVPLILAVPVFAVVHMIFGNLMRILYVVGGP